MELLLVILIYAIPIYCLWIWSQRKYELTKKIDRMKGKYTAVVSIIAPDMGRESGDMRRYVEDYRRVIIYVLNRRYDADTADKISAVILERVSNREGYLTFDMIILEGILAQIEYEQDRHITPRQRKKISNIMFRNTIGYYSKFYK